MNIKSIFIFIGINIVSLIVTLLHLYSLNNIILHFIFIILRNYLTAYLLDYFNSHRKKILYRNKRADPHEEYTGEFLIKLISTSLIELFTTLFILYLFDFSSPFNLINYLLFFLTSFLFEIIFDFFHYWTHKIIHNMPWLYKLTHKVHHKHIYPKSITAFHQDPIDLLITNSFPQIITLYILQLFGISFSLFSFLLIITFKVFVEVFGHSGMKFRGSSFIQLIWLPKLFGIELKTEDHDLHHNNPKYNFSKRFKLWDIIFGTYKQK